MKTRLHFKLMALLIGLSVAGLLCFQGYWLSGLFQSQQESLQKELKEAMLMADYQELFGRTDRVKKHKTETGEICTDPSERQHQAETDSTEATQPLGSMSVTIDSFDPERDTMDDNQDLDSYLSAIQSLEGMLLFTMHSFVDSIAPIDLACYDSLLQAELQGRQIHSNYRITMDSVVSKADSLLTASVKLSNREITVNYPIGHPAGKIIHLHVEDPFQVVIRQMAGILASSLVLLLLVLFAFVYLLRTILQQKTVEELKSDFTNNMTHELKTPISVGYAAMDALLHFDHQADERHRKYLTIAQEQLERLSGLVEQILSLAVEDRATFRLHPEAVELRPLVESLLQQHKLKLDRPAEFQLSIADGLTLTADRTHLYNMLNNLIENALKYADKEPCVITIGARQFDGATELSVSDNGIGICEAYQQQVFEKFFRVPNGNLHNTKGYGLGLYYVKQMMQKHGGWVSLQSRPGKGSTFILHFKRPK